MDIYSILKEGLRGEGSDKMWCITKILSDNVEEYVPEKQKEALLNRVYYSVNGGHFNKESSDRTLARLYYIDNGGIKRFAPYWADSELKPLYDGVKSKIPAYNLYDFIVTMNMVKSDNYMKLKRWFPDDDESELVERMLDETVNWLDDEDNPFGDEKIWKYLNS